MPTKLQKVSGSERTLKNGAVGAYFLNPNGSRSFRFIKGPSVGVGAPGGGVARASVPRGPRTYKKLSLEEAQRAYTNFYSGTPKWTKGPKKGLPRYASKTSQKAAQTYDLRHTLTNPKRVVTDSRYERRPDLYDYPGVDTGSAVRAPATPAQLAARKRGFEALQRKQAMARARRVPGAARFSLV